MEHNIYIYIAVMALVTYAIRVLPLTLIRKEIKNPFIRSFLYYVPYACLTAMLCPIHHARSNDLSCYPAGNTNTCCRCSCPRRRRCHRLARHEPFSCGLLLLRSSVYRRIYHGAVRHKKSRRLRRFFSNPAAFCASIN